MPTFQKTVQDNIDGFVSLYVQRRAPSLVGYLKRQNILGRIPDSERPSLLLAIADEMKVDGDRSKLRDVYHRVKAVRDAIAHSADVKQASADDLRLTSSVWSGAGALKGDKPTVTVVTREQLRKRLREARWLLQHVRYVIGADDLVFRMHYRGEQLIFVLPPADPDDWDGQELAVLPTLRD
jgi:hypothetical protein